MRADSSRDLVLRRLAVLCALLVVCVVGISSFIRLSGVGLSCSPWPQCYGQALRDGQQPTQRVGEVSSTPSVAAARLAHRVFAVVLLLLMLVVVFGGFSAKPDRWDGRWLSVLALLLVAFLAGLGRWTAGTRVPAVVLGNLLGGFLLFGLCWRMARVASRRPADGVLSGATRIAVALAILVVVAQTALGGLVSSGYAGLSCPQVMECTLPTPAPWHMLNPLREPVVDTTVWPVNPDGVVVHWLHRWLAGVAALVIAAAAALLWRDQRQRVALTLLALLGVQGVLGLLMVDQHLPLALAVSHNLFGVVLLGRLMSVD